MTKDLKSQVMSQDIHKIPNPNGNHLDYSASINSLNTNTHLTANICKYVLQKPIFRLNVLSSTLCFGTKIHWDFLRGAMGRICFNTLTLRSGHGNLPSIFIPCGGIRYPTLGKGTSSSTVPAGRGYGTVPGRVTENLQLTASPGFLHVSFKRMESGSAKNVTVPTLLYDFFQGGGVRRTGVFRFKQLDHNCNSM